MKIRGPFKILPALVILLSTGILSSCTKVPETSLERSPASEIEGPSATGEDAGFVYDRATLRRAANSVGRNEVVDGLLAASAEEILVTEDLHHLIAQNANDTCVSLGQMHGRVHRRAVSSETEQFSGRLAHAHQRGLSQAVHHSQFVRNHDDRIKFCQKISRYNAETSRPLSVACDDSSVEVLPLYFTRLECDNAGDSADEESTQRSGPSRRNQIRRGNPALQ